MINVKDKNSERKVRHARVRKKPFWHKCKTKTFVVYRSLNKIYAQIIDDERRVTLVSASSLDKELAPTLAGKTKTEQAKMVGESNC